MLYVILRTLISVLQSQRALAVENGLYWRRKSRSNRPGRLKVAREVRDLIRQMSGSNPLWGARRIHGELLKLGIETSQAAVSRYMTRRRKPPSQGWRTFLQNHAEDIISVDFFTVPTATFRVLFVFLMLSNARRRVVHFNVTASPHAAWAGQQIIEAFPWDAAPRFLVRDRLERMESSLETASAG